MDSEFGLLESDDDVGEVGGEDGALVEVAADGVDGGDGLADVEGGEFDEILDEFGVFDFLVDGVVLVAVK